MNDYLPFAVLVFGAVVVLTEIILLYKSKLIASDKSIHLLGVTMVIVAILFMLTGAISNEFIAPVVGLLGTIVGYVAGRQTDADHTDQL